MSNHIRILLDIQDQNIIFEDHCVKTGKFKGNDCKYAAGKLTYDPTHCKTCGIKNEDDIVTKNGTQMSRITLPITGVKPTYLLLKKQRFVCKVCACSFTARTPIVKKDCYISEHTKIQIVIKSAEAQSLISIARDCSVSPTTVQRVITKEAKPFKPHHQIKVLNRVAYGYRNFSNFKNRIMLHFKLKPVGRKMGQEYNETHPHVTYCT